MIDKRSYEIKRKLKETFKGHEFKVKIEKYSMGESIKIRTNLLTEVKYTDAVWRVQNTKQYSETDMNEYVKFKKAWEAHNKKELEVKNLLRQFEKVSYDERGDILEGCNTYLFVQPL